MEGMEIGLGHGEWVKCKKEQNEKELWVKTRMWGPHSITQFMLEGGEKEKVEWVKTCEGH